jgi:hypothetical protein
LLRTAVSDRIQLSFGGGMIRQCDQADVAAMFEIINGAAQAYKEIILAARAVHLLEELQYGIGAEDMRRSVHIAWTKF